MRPMPLERENLSDLVAQRLVQYIEDNNLQPGDLLPTEKELAEAFSVGRTSVREGISKLKNAGLLSSVQGYGCIINEVTFGHFFSNFKSSILNQFIQIQNDELYQIAETRVVFETNALRTYFASGVDVDLHEISILLRKMGKAMLANNRELFYALDLRFHFLIVQLANNSILTKTYGFIKDSFLSQTQALITHCDDMASIQEEHHKIVTGIMQRDESTVELLETHLKRFLLHSSS